MKEQYKRQKAIQIGKHRIEHWQIVAFFLMVYDFITVCAAYFLALLLRFSFVTSQPSKNGLVLA